MQVVKEFMIDGKVVEETTTTLLGHKIYTNKDDEGSDITFYFVDKSGSVKEKLVVDADCSQNFGYVSDWKVEKVS